MKVSAVVPYHSGQNYIDYCLGSLLKESEPLNEVIIISNNEAEAYPPNILTEDPRLKIHHTQENLGYSDAVNRGVSYAQNELILLCDADVFFPNEGWLASHVACHQNRKNVGITSGKELSYQTGLIADFGIGRTARNHFHPFKDHPSSFPATLSCRQVQIVASAMAVVSKELFQNVGGMNNRLLNFYQDVDFSLKVKELGKEIWVLGDTIFFHRCHSASVTSSALQVDDRGILMAYNAHRAKVDFQYYLSERFDYLLSDINIDERYLIIDISTINTKDEVLEVIYRYISADMYFKYYPKSRDEDAIFLMDILPAKTQFIDRPFIFLVDRHISLRNNVIWYQMRTRHDDLIVDRHANVVSLQQAVGWKISS